MHIVAVFRGNRCKNSRRALTVVGAFLCGVICQAQTISGEMVVTDRPAYLYLDEVIGGKGYVIDSCEVTHTNYMFDLAGKPFGYYRLRISGENRIDFIYDGNPIRMNFLAEILQDNLIVKESDENKLLWNYKYYGRAVSISDRQYVIRQSYLETGSSEWRKLQSERDYLQIKKQSYLDSLCHSHPYSIFRYLVGATQRKPYLTESEKKDHYFDNIDFSNPMLLRSSILPSTIMNYFHLHTEYSEEGFVESVDRILALVSVNDENYEFCLNFILDLFNRVGPDVVFQYVVETYLLNGGCVDIGISEQIQELVENYQTLMPGNKAPSFIISDTAEKAHALEKELIKTEYTVLYFWSSHCSFCMETSPRLIAWNELHANVQVIAISLDEDKTDWKNYLERNPSSILHLSQLAGWKSAVVKDYMVHKTPSFYVMNRNGVIKGKPKNLEALFGMFETK